MITFSFFCSIPIAPLDINADWFAIIAEPENRKTMKASRDFLLMMERKYLKSGKFSIVILNENVGFVFITFPLTPFDPFYETFENKISRLVQAGIYPPIPPVVGSTRIMRDDEVPALVLALDDLGIGFVICSITALLSVTVFFIEFAIPKAKSTVKTCIGNILVLYILVKIIKRIKI